jgi:hypothetical protein
MSQRSREHKKDKGVKPMDKFKKGDIVYHKATLKRCVVKGPSHNGGLLVTTENDEVKNYQPEELWSEGEWNKRNENIIGVGGGSDLDPYQ